MARIIVATRAAKQSKPSEPVVSVTMAAWEAVIIRSILSAYGRLETMDRLRNPFSSGNPSHKEAVLQRMEGAHEGLLRNPVSSSIDPALYDAATHVSLASPSQPYYTVEASGPSGTYVMTTDGAFTHGPLPCPLMWRFDTKQEAEQALGRWVVRFRSSGFSAFRVMYNEVDPAEGEVFVYKGEGA